MSIFDIIWLIIGVILFCASLWWFGHRVGWGSYSSYFVCADNLTLRMSSADKVNMGFSINGIWVGGWNAVYVLLDNDTLVLMPERWFRWALPPFAIPLSNITTVCREKHFLIDRARVDVVHSKASLLLPHRYEKILKDLGIRPIGIKTKVTKGVTH